MRHVFADACFWIAMTNPLDGLYDQSMQAYNSVSDAVVHTTADVLCEYLNYFSAWGAEYRARAVKTVEMAMSDSHIYVHFQSSESFMTGIALYKERSDKAWSLVDCISFNTMRHHDICDALSSDRHFTQAGFIILLPQT